jgi:cytochrome c oxidase assembly factor CtaG
MDDVSVPPPGLASVFTEWSAQPVGIALAAVLTVGYVIGLRRLAGSGRRWPAGRTATFAFGLLLLVWTSCGFPAAYDTSLYWVWAARVLVLWLIVPIIVLSGHPVQLARAARISGSVDRLLRSRPARFVANPLVGPALVPILSAVLFFGPLAGWALEFPPVSWLIDLLLLLLGALMVLALLGLDGEPSSLAVGLSLAIGSFELVLDALPGIVLRLHTTLATSWFQFRELQPWSPAPLRDQQVAGAILWCLAEVIDLPFLLLVFRRWLQADARDAARVDAVLEAERAARRALRGSGEAGAEPGNSTVQDAAVAERDAPWWESDPAMQERLRRQG